MDTQKLPQDSASSPSLPVGVGFGEVPRILVLDDEVAIADLVSQIFKDEGFSVLTFYHPLEALEAARKEPIDLALVDLMMPAIDGFEFCRRLQAFSSASVIFLTAKDEETDVVVGFALGADDYITKPFKPRELVARVKARLRRVQGRSTASRPGLPQDVSRETFVRNFGESGFEGAGVLEARGISLDPRTHQVAVHDIPLSLTPKEFDILALLLRNAGAPVSSRVLYETVWEEPANQSSANTVMVHIRHLRCKLEAVDSSQEFIKTAWGVGYLIPAER